MPEVSRTGFRPVKHATGDSYNGQFNMYFIPSSDATAVGIGDLVKLAGSADTAANYPTVARLAANTDVAVGVVVGFMPNPDNLNTPANSLRSASTDRYVLVADEPGMILEGQADATFTAAGVGLNYGVTFTAPSATTGTSGMQVGVSTGATTATLPLQVLGVVNRPNNDLTANTKLLCRLNSAAYQAGVAGV